MRRVALMSYRAGRASRMQVGRSERGAERGAARGACVCTGRHVGPWNRDDRKLRMLNFLNLIASVSVTLTERFLYSTVWVKLTTIYGLCTVSFFESSRGTRRNIDSDCMYCNYDAYKTQLNAQKATSVVIHLAFMLHSSLYNQLEVLKHGSLRASTDSSCPACHFKCKSMMPAAVVASSDTEISTPRSRVMSADA